MVLLTARPIQILALTDTPKAQSLADLMKLVGDPVDVITSDIALFEAFQALVLPATLLLQSNEPLQLLNSSTDRLALRRPAENHEGFEDRRHVWVVGEGAVECTARLKERGYAMCNLITRYDALVFDCFCRNGQQSEARCLAPWRVTYELPQQEEPRAISA